jgi:DNA-binding protein H-NS
LVTSPDIEAMAKSLKQVLAQIDSLQKQAEQIRKKEIAGVIERIQEAIDHYGLTVQDLFGKSGSSVQTVSAKGSKVVKARSSRKKSPVSFPKYYLDGQSWSGQGRRPKWYIEALAAGKKPEEMLVQN